MIARHNMTSRVHVFNALHLKGENHAVACSCLITFPPVSNLKKKIYICESYLYSSFRKPSAERGRERTVPEDVEVHVLGSSGGRRLGHLVVHGQRALLVLGRFLLPLLDRVLALLLAVPHQGLALRWNHTKIPTAFSIFFLSRIDKLYEFDRMISVRSCGKKNIYFLVVFTLHTVTLNVIIAGPGLLCWRFLLLMAFWSFLYLLME